MLSVRLDNRELLKVLSHALPHPVFETIRFSWNPKSLTAEAMDKARSFLGRVTISASAFNEYAFERPGEVAVFTDKLLTVLAFALVGRSDITEVRSTWRFVADSLRLSLSVAGVGKLNHVLRNVPDALGRPVDPDMNKAAVFLTDSPQLLREVHSATTWAELVKARFTSKGISFVDSKAKENWFELGVAGATGDAETILDRASLDYATKLLEHCTPSRATMMIADAGFGMITYEFANARVDYYIPTEVSLE